MLHAAVEHVVADLVGGDRAVLLALLHHVDVEVGDAVVADLAVGLEALEAIDCLVERRGVIAPVDQQQVDHVGLEAAQAAFGAFDDVVASRVQRDGLRAVVEVEANLGDELNLVAALAERCGEELFGVVGTVALGGVEQRDAAVDRVVDGA